jgi:hypothetical protein
VTAVTKQQFIAEIPASRISSNPQWSGLYARVPAHRGEVATWLRYQRKHRQAFKKTRRGYIGIVDKYLFIR